MKYLISILFLIIGLAGFSQIVSEQFKTYTPITIYGSDHGNVFYIPTVNDTTNYTGDDSLGMIIYNTIDKRVYLRDSISTGGHKWTAFPVSDELITRKNNEY